MKICIHRGSDQIGGNCVELEQDGQRVILDLGLPLDVLSNDKSYLPQIEGLNGNDPSLLGILTSHTHLDHTGLLKHISTDIPVWMGPAARRIMSVAYPFLPDKFPVPPSGLDYQAWKSVELGPFIITPYLVDHSAYDAYALLIEANGKRLFYSGDFRSHGRKSALFANLIKKPPQNIDVLLMEGSSLGRLDHEHSFPTEEDIEHKLDQVLSTTKGLAMVHASAQNIDRVVSILKASKKSGRRMVIDLYTALILEATQNKNIPQSHWPDVALFVPFSQRLKIKNNAWFDQLKRHSTNRIYIESIQKNPEKFTLLFRPLYVPDLKGHNCLQDAVYIYSQWEGYWDRGDYQHIQDWLANNHIQKISIHTSGHASPKDLKKLVNALAPDRVVAIHTFEPALYSSLFPNVENHADGQWWEI